MVRLNSFRLSKSGPNDCSTFPLSPQRSLFLVVQIGSLFFPRVTEQLRFSLGRVPSPARLRAPSLCERALGRTTGTTTTSSSLATTTSPAKRREAGGRAGSFSRYASICLRIGFVFPCWFLNGIYYYWTTGIVFHVSRGRICGCSKTCTKMAPWRMEQKFKSCATRSLEF